MRIGYNSVSIGVTIQHVIYIVEYCNNLVIRSSNSTVVLQNYDCVCNIVRANALLCGRDSLDTALSALILRVINCNKYAVIVEGIGASSCSSAGSNLSSALLSTIGTDNSSVQTLKRYIIDVVAIDGVGDYLTGGSASNRSRSILNQSLSALVGPYLVSSLLLTVYGYSITITGQVAVLGISGCARNLSATNFDVTSSNVVQTILLVGQQNSAVSSLVVPVLDRLTRDNLNLGRSLNIDNCIVVNRLVVNLLVINLNRASGDIIIATSLVGRAYELDVVSIIRQLGEGYKTLSRCTGGNQNIISLNLICIRSSSASYQLLAVVLGQLKVNDTWYKVATNGASNVADDTASIKSGSTYDFAIVGNYIVNAKETESSSNDILVVTDFESAKNGMQSSTTQKVKAYFLDGSSKTIEVEKLALTAGEDAEDETSKNCFADDNKSVNHLFTYSTRSNGTYTLKALGTSTAADGTTLSNKAGYENVGQDTEITAKNKIGKYSINDSAVVFALYNTVSGATNIQKDVKVLSGKTVNDWSTKYGSTVYYATKKSNGIETVSVAVVVAKAKYNGAGSDYKYAYMTSDSYKGTNGEDNDETTVYEAWTGSENVTLKYDGGDGTPKSAGNILIYTDDGADFINVEAAKDTKTMRVAITGIQKVKEGDVAVKFNGGSDTYSMDEDCVYIAVNDDKQEGMEGSSLDQISLAEETSTAGQYYANAWIVLEKNDDGTYGDILAIIYDADNNRLKGNKIF